MRISNIFGALSVLSLANSQILPRQNDSSYVGYLLSTFSDADPRVSWYLADASDPLGFTALNGGEPVLESTVGTGAVRDLFLVSNAARSEYFLIGTDLDVDVPDFSWDEATRQGSRALTIWRSNDLVDWSEPTLTTVEDETAGMAWAPSAVWNDDEQQYYLFWATRVFDPADPDHTGDPASLDKIRYATTADFVTISEPSDYEAPEGIALIDQEFLDLGSPGAYARFIKDESVSQVYQEVTTSGLFGEWTRVSQYVTEDFQHEGPAAFPDINNSGRYYLLVDDYTEYIPFQTDDIQSGTWEQADASQFPSGLKHGSVFLLTQTEYDAIVSQYSS